MGFRAATSAGHYQGRIVSTIDMAIDVKTSAPIRDGAIELRGLEMIRNATLTAFDNRTVERDYTVQFVIPEFTCLCPMTGFPDFATLYIRYVPGPRCVE